MRFAGGRPLCLPADGLPFRFLCFLGQAKCTQPLEFGIGRQLGLPLFGEDSLIALPKLGKACLTTFARFPALRLIGHGAHGIAVVCTAKTPNSQRTISTSMTAPKAPLRPLPP